MQQLVVKLFGQVVGYLVSSCILQLFHCLKVASYALFHFAMLDVEDDKNTSRMFKVSKQL